MLPLENNQPQNSVNRPRNGAVTLQKNNSAYRRVLEMIMMFLSKWYWFVICLGISLVCCYFYLLTTPSIYTRTASILIKNELAGTSSANMKFLDSHVDVNNELFTLRSPNIAEAVVKNLRLDISYYVQGRFREEMIYGSNLNIDIIPLDLDDNEYAEFIFDLTSNGTYTLSNFSRNGRELSGKVVGKIGKVVNTPIGKIEVKKAANFYNQDITLRVKRIPISAAVSKTLANLNVSAVSELSTIISLSYNDENPQRAEDVLSTVIAVYNENWVKDCNRRSVSTSEFIGERLRVIEEELGNVEEGIATFKSENLIPGGSSNVAGIYVGQATSATAQTTELNNQLYMARYVRNYLTNDANKYTLIPANQGINSPNIGSQLGEYNSLLRSRNNLLNASSLQNPLVQEMDAQLEELRMALIASVDNHIASLGVELRTAQSILGQANSKIASSPSQSRYLLSVERQQKVKESLYLFLLQKREENELSQAFTAYNNRIITPATGSNVPTYPVPKLVWMIGIIAGLVVPALIIFVVEMMNNTIRGRRDLDELTVPFIGEIPMYRHHRKFKEKLFAPWYKFKKFLNRHVFHKEEKEKKDLHILVKEKSRSLINEAFRVIRTNIEFMTAKTKKGKVVMLTSFNPNSGKTFVASNLVISFAINKKKVLAIDLDLRKASLSQMAGDAANIGIADYLSGVTDKFSDIVVKSTQHENLDIVPVGTIPPNPTELLFDSRLDDLLHDLRDKYDYIFLDCPPVEIVADATIVGRSADATLFLIRADLMDKNLLPEIQKYYDDDRLPKMSLILNGITEGFSYYYGYRGYAHRYGYYGGYTHDKD
ncbi:MAG: polysaccharide biosynthesis tyrosine autokinase [Prevotellaceae bacterium]|nr:polysaccharide biosynthesis tyrosine autokinase [Prevotellaceae bacterium]